MAQYPVEDQAGILEGLNYVLSGPSGLGQNFQGYNATGIDTGDTSGIAYITNNFQQPYTQYAPADLYVAPIALALSEQLDAHTYKFTFDTAQAAPPFSLGSRVTVAGTDTGYYDGLYGGPGVVQCTVDYVITYLGEPFEPLGEPSTGGTIQASVMGISLGTDCNAKITVEGGTNQALISAQINNKISYTASTASDLKYTVTIDRLKGRQSIIAGNTSYGFYDATTLMTRVYSGGALSGLTGTGTLDNIETIFSTFIDRDLPVGYYWYFLDVRFEVTNGGDLEITQSQVGLRSLTAQSVKQ